MALQLPCPAYMGSLPPIAYIRACQKTRYAQTVLARAALLTLIAFGGDKWGSLVLNNQQSAALFVGQFTASLLVPAPA